tara:strand:- start:100 stop:426 length:327 start_codon:yes stop_codon:yes gene_type:complete
MVHTRTGAGSEPLNLSSDLQAAADAGIQCPICFETRPLHCTAVTPCGHGVCIACTPLMLYEDLRSMRIPTCVVCRRPAGRDDEEFYTYMFRRTFRERAVVMLQRLCAQ